VNYELFNDYLNKNANLFLKNKLSEFLMKKYVFLNLGDKLTKELINTTLIN
jgi:hypothetical protein